MTPSTSELLSANLRQLESEAFLLSTPHLKDAGLRPQQREALADIESRIRALRRALDLER